jgi:hypothetical protein
MTFLTIVETMAGHDLNHLKQLQRLPGVTGAEQSPRAILEK